MAEPTLTASNSELPTERGDVRDDGDASSFAGTVVQLTVGHPVGTETEVTDLVDATIRLTASDVTATVGSSTWSWVLADIEEVFHGGAEPWTILAVPGVADHGVAVGAADVTRFREELGELLPSTVTVHRGSAGAWPGPARTAPIQAEVDDPSRLPTQRALDEPTLVGVPEPLPATVRPPRVDGQAATSPSVPAGLHARAISAWFGTHLVLDRVSLEMAPGRVTALIGPSGCGKSTFLRILNRMHELIPSAALAGEVLLDGADIYDTGQKVTDVRRQIGMVFQKPNPFPAMSIYDNVVAGFQLTGRKVNGQERDAVVEASLRKAGLWNEVRERLRQPGGGLSGGQQQRLCIARALAMRPRVLLMDEPCSALDPTSTRRIEETIHELAADVTIVIVTHNMQQAARVSSSCAFFLAEQGTPGVIVEHGPTGAMFHSPQDPRTNDYVNGRFG